MVGPLQGRRLGEGLGGSILSLCERGEGRLWGEVPLLRAPTPTQIPGTRGAQAFSQPLVLPPWLLHTHRQVFTVCLSLCLSLSLPGTQGLGKRVSWGGRVWPPCRLPDQPWCGCGVHTPNAVWGGIPWVTRGVWPRQRNRNRQTRVSTTWRPERDTHTTLQPSRPGLCDKAYVAGTNQSQRAEVLNPQMSRK